MFKFKAQLLDDFELPKNAKLIPENNFLLIESVFEMIKSIKSDILKFISIDPETKEEQFVQLYNNYISYELEDGILMIYEYLEPFKKHLIVHVDYTSWCKENEIDTIGITH